MIKNDPEEILAAGLALMNLQLPAAAVTKLRLYYQELVKWNRSINLIAAAPMETVIESHFLDSLNLLLLLQEPGAGRDLLDVGSGAGFPGLVLKIALPELKVSLVEPRNKRVSFLKHLIRTLSLRDVTVHAERLEKGGNTLAGETRTFPLITSRALASVSDFLDLVAGYSPAGGLVICMKGPQAEEEIGAWNRQQPESVFTLQRVVKGSLPFSQAQRSLIIFEKRGL